MKKQFWNCEIQKNWSGELREDMLDRNILCYGKARSGKTEKVAKPFLRRAIEQGRWILLVMNKTDDDYSDIYREAREAGYQFVDHEVKYATEGNIQEVKEYAIGVLEQPREDPIFIRATMDPANKYYDNSVRELLLNYSIIVRNRGNITDFSLQRLSLVMENSDWEIPLEDSLMSCDMLNICVTMDCRRLSGADTVGSQMNTTPRTKSSITRNGFIVWYISLACWLLSAESAPPTKDPRRK